jgi:hypothetical protein
VKVLTLVQNQDTPAPITRAHFCPACGQLVEQPDVVREFEDQVRTLTGYARALEDELDRRRALLTESG